MAKLFTNIAKTNISSSVQKYSQSTINTVFPTFKNLRDTAKINDFNKDNVLETNIQRNVYDLYTSASTATTRNYQSSILNAPTVFVRRRLTPFYAGFPIVNPLIRTQSAPENGTAVEIRPYSPAPTGPVGSINLENRYLYAVETATMRGDGRMNPLISATRDIKRINSFLASGRGVRFHTMQTTLQGGNVFKQSSAYDPLAVGNQIGNYANVTENEPLERVVRMFTGKAITDITLQGRLQIETVIREQKRLQQRYTASTERIESGTTPQNTLVSSFKDRFNNYLRNKVDTIEIPIPGFVRNLANFSNKTFGSNFTAGKSITVGNIRNKISKVATAAEAFQRSLDKDNATLEKDQTAYDGLYAANVWPIMKQPYGGTGGNPVSLNFHNEKAAYITRTQAALQQAKKEISKLNNENLFTVAYPQPETNEYRSSATYTEDIRNSGNAANTKSGVVSARYMKDTFNLRGTNGVLADPKELEKIGENDIVTFKIVVPGVYDTGIKFRAFIEDFNHTARGQYEDIRYVGRPERFITYKGMNRTITLSLFLVAFSENETDGIWARANMLNKLVYPIGENGGFMTPPLAKLTLGNMIVDQPGYVDNVEMRLQGIPWDIDKELPMAVKLNMNFNVIEKAFVQQKITYSEKSTLFNYAARTTRPVG